MILKTIYDTSIDYVDGITSSRHILLLYEDLEYAKMIMFRFIKNGLVKGETCVYATEEDSGSVVVQMLSYGILLQYFQSKQLQVLQLENRSGNKDEILESCRRDITILQMTLKAPFRIVSRIVPNVSTMEGISAELEIEKNTQNQFDALGGSVMCPYDISKIERKGRKQWLDSLRENHHAVIYVPKSGYSGVTTLD